MAKIKFGMMMTDARGKLGGQVFSKNRSGAYIRTKVTPVNPQTVAQSAVRSNLGVLSSAWSALTASAIAAFNSAVEDWQTTDIFGDLKKPTGKNLFVKLNLNLLNNGLPVVQTVPEKIQMPNLSDLTVEKVEDEDTITISGLEARLSGVYQIEATPILPNGVSFVKNRLRVIASIPASSAFPLNVATQWNSKFGAITDGANVSFRVRYIGENGQASTPIIVKMVDVGQG